MLNEFPKLAQCDVEPKGPPFPSAMRPFEKPLMTQAELNYEALNRVNAVIHEVTQFERFMKENYTAFTDKTTTDNAAFKENISAIFDQFSATVTNEVNGFETSVNDSFTIFTENIKNSYAAFTAALNADYDKKMSDAEKYMVSNLTATVRKLFNEKIVDGSIESIMTDVFGNGATFKGSDTTAAITAKSGNNGDVWYSTDGDTYYQKTESGWVNVGNGSGVGSEVKNARSSFDTIGERIEADRAAADGMAYIGNSNRVIFANEDLVFPVGKGLVIVWGKNRVNLDDAKILEQLPNYATSDGSVIKITVAGGNTLVYDSEAATLKMLTSYSPYLPEHVVLLRNYYSYPSGLLADTSLYYRMGIEHNAAVRFHSVSGSNIPASYKFSVSTNRAEITCAGFNVNIGGAMTSFNKAAIMEQLPLNYVESGDTITISIPYEKFLVFNTITKRLEIVSDITTINNRCVLLVYTYYFTPHGKLIDAIANNFAMNIGDDLATDVSIATKSIRQEIQVMNNRRIDLAITSTEAKITIEGGGFYLYIDNGRKSFKNDGIVEALPDNAVVNDDGSVTITVPAGYALAYDYEKDVLCVKYYENMNYKFANLYTSYWKNDFGLFYDYVATHWVNDSLTGTTNPAISLVDTLNSAPMVVDYGWEAAAREYSALFNNTDDVEGFLFFTDPHLCQWDGWETECNNYIKFLQKVYNSTPTDFIVCGGDWLGNNDTMDEACFKLGYIDGFMHSMFDNYFHVVGNHDTNYQGLLEEGAEKWTGTLTNETVRNLWFRNEGKAYYSFTGKHSDFYVLDTQLDSVDEMTPYKWEQVQWFAKMLKEDDRLHNAVFMHIVFTADDSIGTMAQNIGAVIEAYNSKGTITIEGVAYSFADCVGHVDFVLCGHNHKDYASTLGGVPCLSTTHMRDGGTPSFDLCLCDYNTNTLTLVRVGTGENRTVNF